VVPGGSKYIALQLPAQENFSTREIAFQAVSIRGENQLDLVTEGINTR
jgi:hypothetical protein